VVNVFRAVGRSLKLVGLFVEAGTELAVTRPSTRVQRADWLHRFCARSIRRMGIELSVEGEFPKQGAVISNHLSYLDIVVFAALHRCVFVSKAEVGAMPVVGWMTTMSGTVYVERGRGGSARKARDGMRAAEAAGLPVVFFPEGTTSDGSRLLKFHSGLLAQVLDAGSPITAAYLEYSLDVENGPDVRVGEDVCWGDRNMLAHIFKLLSLRGVRATVRFAERPIVFSSDGLHRKLAAVEARAAIEELRS
jgi:1-acyl-sn-glycerol-3-phosphate acyltransferase